MFTSGAVLRFYGCSLSERKRQDVEVMRPTQDLDSEHLGCGQHVHLTQYSNVALLSCPSRSNELLVYCGEKALTACGAWWFAL